MLLQNGLSRCKLKLFFFPFVHTAMQPKRKRFCEHIGANKAVPMHCGLFDSIDMNEFDYEPKVVPAIYEEITL